jgi:fructose-1,6-bisphosphatase/inositol monophosphatase family enzyme
MHLDRARRLLCSLQDTVRDALQASRARTRRRFAEVAAVTAADTIYRIDRVSEEAILGWFEEHWPKGWPVEIVMEGLEGKATTFPRGTPVRQTQWKCILDPIDGTRGLMHDKRPAWSLAGLAPQRGARTNLRDIVVAAMTELPTTKQWRADQVSAVRGSGLKAEAIDVRSGSRERLKLQPSRATDFKHGFATFARFFPGAKAVISDIEEALWAELHVDEIGSSPLIFEDQYISTGGQIYELIAGHDRMVADLRPLAFRKLGLPDHLTCHPYDICVALLLEEVGGVVADADGKRLRAPLDTTSPVSWVGYANPILARQVRPVLKRLIAELLGS